MFSSRASEERDLTPSLPVQSSVTSFAPAAESGSQATVFTHPAAASDVRWIVGTLVLYALLLSLSVLALHPYFGQTWDVITFVHAGNTILSPEWASLYQQSRAERYWPYAYPPLHAFVVAPFVSLSGLAPDWLLVRLPPLLFDLALGVLLYHIVAVKTHARGLARRALAGRLLNPVTWYDTAVQGHFETEWLFFVVVAYWLAEQKRGWLLPTLALAVAFLFKQNAILFAVPFWFQLGFARRDQPPLRRILTVTASLLAYAVPILVVSLPFLLHSNDYWFMNVQYIADVPLQTQSWLVALAGIFSPNTLILSLSSLFTFAAVVGLALWAQFDNVSLWLTAMLIVLAFFLLSKKVVGYYYVMLLPFALVTLIPARHWRLLSIIVAAISFISLSPYFASWAQPAHWWAYALLGLVNSALWLGILVWLVRSLPTRSARLFKESDKNRPLPTADTPSRGRDAMGLRTGADISRLSAVGVLQGEGGTVGQRSLAFLAVSIFLCAIAASLLQPLVNSPASPIRAPLIQPGLEMQVLMAGIAFVLLIVLALVVAALYSRTIAQAPAVALWPAALVVFLAPLYFMTFTLTKESTAFLEMILKP